MNRYERVSTGSSCMGLTEASAVCTNGDNYELTSTQQANEMNVRAVSIPAFPTITKVAVRANHSPLGNGTIKLDEGRKQKQIRN